MSKPVQWKEVWVVRTQTGMYLSSDGSALMKLKNAMQFDSSEEAKAWMDFQPLPSLMAENVMVQI